ncbi:type II toxin-antitoxin system PemK/MazF family toxin [Corynebacterium lizhenjunii]|uniref:Type II toxin-antitoxin system PemK/MazF family toxin n=1 Tax=Corynebacterium lizhenjunii TaxID=2709394 RepID=A0A7T0KD98_9CORY|nr:type II toxin-antitoxin system PemK/MazF family toxin [Corynebacterium lizhenjunii]QPK78638.1 type II toxin-antitoxin system PemK/MazF family toxin [Corynebacterium lizhenjunii]
MTSAKPSGRSRLKRLLGIHDSQPLDTGLARINDRLGFRGSRASREPRRAAVIGVEHTEARPRSIFFTPDMDGQADSGEVVWAWVGSPPQERAILVVGRTRTTVLGLLISPNPDHADEDCWLPIGSGEWDERGRQCWIRMDRVLELSEEQVRRQGTLFPERRFARIANRLRAAYHWG